PSEYLSTDVTTVPWPDRDSDQIREELAITTTMWVYSIVPALPQAEFELSSGAIRDGKAHGAGRSPASSFSPERHCGRWSIRRRALPMDRSNAPFGVTSTSTVTP